MKNRSKARHLHKPIYFGTAIVVIVLLVGISFVLIRNHDKNTNKQPPVNPVNTINYGSSTSQDNSLNNQRKSNPSNAAQTLDNGATNSNSSNSSVGATITRASSTGSNSTYAVTAAANVTGATSGSCKFTASMSGQQSVSQTSQIQASNQNYVCQPVVINLPLKGNWYISLTVTSNGQTSSSSNWTANPVSVE